MNGGINIDKKGSKKVARIGALGNLLTNGPFFFPQKFVDRLGRGLFEVIVDGSTAIIGFCVCAGRLKRNRCRCCRFRYERGLVVSRYLWWCAVSCHCCVCLMSCSAILIWLHSLVCFASSSLRPFSIYMPQDDHPNKASTVSGRAGSGHPSSGIPNTGACTLYQVRGTY